MNKTVSNDFADTAREAPEHTFLVIPPTATAEYAATGVSLSYGQAWTDISRIRERRYAAYGILFYDG